MGALIFAEGERWVALIFFGFALLGAYLLWEYLEVRYAPNPDGFRYRTLFAGAGEARWSEVTAVRWSQASKWFRLELRDGRVVRISVLMLGLARERGHQPTQRKATALCEQLLALRSQRDPDQQQLCTHQRTKRFEQHEAQGSEKPGPCFWCKDTEPSMQRACSDLALEGLKADHFTVATNGEREEISLRVAR